MLGGIETGEADQDEDGKISIDELFYYAERRVKEVRPEQTPMKDFLVRDSKIVIARNPHRVVKRLSLELQEAIESDLVWRRLGAVSGLEHLLQGRDESLVRAAREALERLAKEDNSRQVSAKATKVLGTVPVTKPAAKPPAPVEAKKPSVKPAPDTLTLTKPFQMKLVRVPAGEFLMGSDPAKDKYAQGNEQPQHKVNLPEFYIGKYPVINAHYAAFVKATGYEAHERWKGGKFPMGDKNSPGHLRIVGTMPWSFAAGWRKKVDTPCASLPRPSGKRRPGVQMVEFMPGVMTGTRPE